MSGDGANQNPDYNTLEWIVTTAAEQQHAPTLVIANRTAEVERLLGTHAPRSNSYLYRILDPTKDWPPLDVA